MSDEQRYTLAQLAAASGVSARTIRYYTAEGLLPPPAERGRYALYGAEHLRRLELIGRLKAAYLPLAAIRERLAARPATPAPPVPPPSHDTAAPPHDFGFRVSAQLGGHATPVRLTGQSTTPGYAALFPYPDDKEIQAASGASGDLWLRVELAPGVELHLRTPLSPERRERLDRLIADARELLSDDQ